MDKTLFFFLPVAVPSAVLTVTAIANGMGGLMISAHTSTDPRGSPSSIDWKSGLKATIGSVFKEHHVHAML